MIHGNTSSFGRIAFDLLLDSIGYDIAVLERLNRLLQVLEQALTPEELERVQRMFVESRGVPYRRVDTLVFSPSEDLGRVAACVLKERMAERSGGLLWQAIRHWVASAREEELEWASYLFFDRELARRFIDIGKQDGWRRSDEIRRFFGKSLCRGAAG